MQSFKAKLNTANWQRVGHTRRATWWSAGALTLSLLAMLFSASAPAEASATHPAGWWPGQSGGRPPVTNPGGPPGILAYTVSIDATWAIPNGSTVTFVPVASHCTRGPLYSGSFTTGLPPFRTVIQLLTADTRVFPSGCYFRYTRGNWVVTVTLPNGTKTSAGFEVDQIGPRTYRPRCTPIVGPLSCHGRPSPVPLQPVAIVHFSIDHRLQLLFAGPSPR
jgi:hypothetical protein